MKKKAIALLLALMLVTSLLPISALATGEGAVTPDEVANAIDKAEGSAEVVITTGEKQSAIDATELIDKANEELKNQKESEDKLDAAVGVVDDANEVISDKADAVQDAQQGAETAKSEAEQQKTAAESAANDAELSKNQAFGASTVTGAIQGADWAGEMSTATAAAAAQAAVKAEAAAQKAEEAKAAYEEAVAAAEKADAEAKELLDAGLEASEEALKKAEEAKALAVAKYKELNAAQKEAKTAAEDAKAAAEAANAALEALKEQLKQTNADNAAAVEKSEALKEVSQGAVDTSAAALDAAQKLVDQNAADLAGLQDAMRDLDKAVVAAKEEIAKLEAELIAKGEDPEQDPTVIAAKEALAGAETTLKNAQTAQAEVQAVIDKKTNADYATAMETLQNKVNDKTATAAEKKALTNLVLQHVGEYDESALKSSSVTWQENASVEKDGLLVFQVGEKLYKVEECTDPETNQTYLQFYEATQSNEDVSVTPNTMMDAETHYKKADAVKPKYSAQVDGQTIEVEVTRSGFGTRWSPYEYNYTFTVGNSTKELSDLKRDKTGYYYETGYGKNKKKHYVTFTETIDVYTPAETAVGTNSNTITDAWADAADKIGGLNDAVTAAQNAYATQEKAVSDAKDAFNQAIDKLNADIATQNGVVTEKTEALGNKSQEFNALNQKQNGETADVQFNTYLRADEVEKQKFDSLYEELSAKDADELTESEKATLEIMTVVNTKYAEVKAMVDALQDGEITEADVQKFVDYLGDDTIPAVTRKLVGELVNNTLDAEHNKNVQAYKDAVAKAEQDAEAGDKAVADKEAEAEKLAAAQEDATKKFNEAKKLTATANKLKNKANAAAKDAQTARDKYDALVKSFTTDGDALVKAYNAWQAAETAAQEAKAVADEANKLAEEAAENARIAREYADRLAKRAAANAATGAEDEKPVEVTAALLQSVAEYAYGKQGELTDLVVAKKTSAAFVEAVYAKYEVKVDLSSEKPDDVVKNGKRIDTKDIQPGDIVYILNEDGTEVVCFGIYYGDGIYVFFNEDTQKVETAKTEDITTEWYGLRVQNAK